MAVLASGRASAERKRQDRAGRSETIVRTLAQTGFSVWAAISPIARPVRTSDIQREGSNTGTKR